MKQTRRAIIASNELSELKAYTLGGYSQKILIEGRRKTNPIVLFLHGGPGSPIPFCAGCRGLLPELTENFTMVYWDQLGCGINDRPIDESFTIAHYVDMAIELICKITEDYRTEKINLFAVSWGSILAARVAAKRPDLINRVLVYGKF